MSSAALTDLFVAMSKPIDVEQVLRVILEDSSRVRTLEDQVDNLSLELAQLRAQHRQLEVRYSIEVNQSLAIKDWCRANGITLPARFSDASV